MTIAAIAGLGNPGDEYAATRHNVGYWLVEYLAAQHQGAFRAEKKLSGDVCQLSLRGQPVRLLRPTTWMNHSGQAVRRLLDFYKLVPEQVLVVHDELDLPPGCVRLKRGGGHGGHNGLRDIIAHCGADFVRLRVGIGHPGHKSQVTGYVLHAPDMAETQLIRATLPAADQAIQLLVADGLERAMHYLHSPAAGE